MAQNEPNITGYEEQEPAGDFKMNPGSRQVHSDDNFRIDSNANAFMESHIPSITKPPSAKGGTYSAGAVETEPDYGKINEKIQGSWEYAAEAISKIDPEKAKENASKRKAERSRKKGARQSWRKMDKEDRKGQSRRGYIESWTPTI